MKGRKTEVRKEGKVKEGLRGMEVEEEIKKNV